MNSVQINKNSHLINVNIKNINPNSDEKYKKYKNYLYIRKCSDYSLYICGGNYLFYINNLYSFFF